MGEWVGKGAEVGGRLWVQESWKFELRAATRRQSAQRSAPGWSRFPSVPPAEPKEQSERRREVIAPVPPGTTSTSNYTPIQSPTVLNTARHQSLRDCQLTHSSLARPT